MANLQLVAPMSLQTLTASPCESCLKLLEGGLEETYNIRRGNSFFQDAKTYFSSDKFQADYERGDWKGNLDFEGIIDGVPVKLGLGANSSSEQVKLFREKIKQTTSITTTSSFFETVSRSTKNTELAKIYVECLIKLCDPNVQDGLDGVVSNTENTSTFVVSYRDRFGTTATVRNFEIRSGGDLLKSQTDYTGGYKKGDIVQPEKIITTKRNPNKDLVLTIDTDRGTKVLTVSSNADIAFRSNRIPIGTIISSYLDFDRLSITTNNHERHAFRIYSPELSYWAPCDGRLIKNSDLASLTNKDNIPNLRGVFLRGLNEFGGNTSDIPANELNNKYDPEDRQIGGIQMEATKMPNNKFIATSGGSEHQHIIKDFSDCHKQLEFDTLMTGQDSGCTHGTVTTKNDGAHSHNLSGGDIETRPTNVAVYYYMRINN